MDNKGELSFNKRTNYSQPQEKDYLAFGRYEGDLYYYKPENNNRSTYETYMMWFDIRWNSAVGIQANWNRDEVYLFVKIQGYIYKYKIGPSLNNINWNDPDVIPGFYLPDELGPIGGPAYDTNRVNATFIPFHDGLIFTMSGAHLNPTLLAVVNSDADWPQYNQRGYCVWIKPDGSVVNLHDTLLDQEFDNNNGRFATIMLSIGEVTGE